jgi:glucans biosynthesis protein
MNRRVFLTNGKVIAQVSCIILFCILLLPGFSRAENSGAKAQSGENNRFGLSDVEAMADELSEKSFSEPGKKAPKFLLDLDYNQWRDIRFDTAESLWRKEGLPFEIQFFHLGAYYERSVEIFVVENGGERKVPFSQGLFDYGENQFEKPVPDDLGYAGFRVHYNLNRPDYKDEFAVFLGASYLRAVGKDMVYGLSARGLAIDTGLDSGEEFPVFSRFWLVKPEKGAGELVVFALLESRSYTGAYRFALRPGKSTKMDVKSRIFKRKPVKKLGIAPLTSMFFYGENTPFPRRGGFRPEVHDSDGLLAAKADGEWLWHPLKNPKSLSTPRFSADNPRGFGLLQRDLDFESYQDLQALYNKRPSAWVKPTGGDWGKGRIELVMIPTDSEYNDNIVAFWVPEGAEEKRALSFDYELSWYMPEKSPHEGGEVHATFMQAVSDKSAYTFLIDFSGGRLSKLDADAYPGERITVDEKVGIVEQRVEKNPYIDGWRMVIKIQGKDKSALEKVFENGSQPINLKGYLHLGDDVLTETWSYVSHP